ncbi:MAG TPA: SidA/IucD/PvdA family monooxygenase, partial [Arenibaculum sp.]|nr:SidA/IucD/PvdA family monooxygenase [Arenibaculum sp.]
RYGHEVQRIELVSEGKHAPHYAVHATDGSVTLGRSLVLAPGRTPYVPKPFEGLDRDHVVHLVEFLSAIKRLEARHPGPCRIAVVGGSQSAVEIILHLAQTMPQAMVTGFLRGFGYRMKDASPFTGEVYFPAFVDLFYGASKAEKQRLTGDLRLTNYSAADADVLDALYLELYRQKILGERRIDIRRSTDIVTARTDGDETELVFEQVGTEGPQSARFDLVILATGFRNVGTAEEQERVPPLFEPLAPWAELDADGCIDVGYDYDVKMKPAFRAAPCYLNGLCESSHGMGDAGSFSLLSLRSETIVGSLASRIGLVEAVANIA